MLNFSKDNLVAVAKEDVTAGTAAIKVNDMVLLLAGGQGGGATAFYKCAEVGTGETSTDIIVSGCGYENTDGTYVLADPAQTGTNRQWKKNDDDLYVIRYDDEMASGWLLEHDGLYIVTCSSIDIDNPVACTGWYDVNEVCDGNLPVLAWTGSGLPAGTWTGYKAVLKEEEAVTTETDDIIIENYSYEELNGTYTLSDTAKTGKDRVWVNNTVTIKYDTMMSAWLIDSSENGNLALSFEDVDDPVDVSEWADGGGVLSEALALKHVTNVTGTGKTYYDFEETVTEGLTYGNGFTPAVGGVYDAEAMIKATLKTKSNVPTEGLVFYASLAEQSDTAETGQSVITSSGISYTTIEGRPCIHFESDSASIEYEFPELISVGATASQSIWFYDTQNDGSTRCISDYGNSADRTHYNQYSRDNEFSVGIQGSEVLAGTIEQNKWYHFCSVIDNGTVKIYINGNLIYTGEIALNLQLKYAKFGDGIRSTNAGLIGYASAARLYNRALTEDEIQQLYQEFSA